MPDKLTDKEIVKALECIAYCKECHESEGCSYYMDNGNICDNISLAKDALDLINRLQAENEKLKSINLLGEYKARIQVGNMIVCTPKIGEWFEFLQNTKNEAYKEFAELVHCHCQDIINQPHNEKVKPLSWKVAYEEFDEYIDNLLKELVGDNNA